MAAIITDQLRITNAKSFVDKVSSSNNSYYTFIGLPNATSYQSNWDDSPPSPKDNFDEENYYWDNMIALKKINASDVRLMIPKRSWVVGTVYDMYRHDYSRNKIASVSGSTTLYSSFYYVMNSEYRVYICLYNGSTPENPGGNPSLDEPFFTDLEPREAGDSGDGYIWKYLYTLKPSEILKFETQDFIPTPSNWGEIDESLLIKNNAVDGSIKVAVLTGRGSGLGAENVYTNVPIKGDGIGAECTIIVNNSGEVDSVTISNQGQGYTYGNVDLTAGGLPLGNSKPTFDVIISPKGGHGYDIYKELGAYNVLMYSRFENDIENPDFITGNQVSRIGIVENPETSTGSILTLDKASAVSALKLVGTGYSTASFTPDSNITQTVGVGITAVGRVINYNSITGVLKYWQDRTLYGFNFDGTPQQSSTYGYDYIPFTSSPPSGGSLTISGNTGSTLTIDSTFTGISTFLNNRTYYLGQQFSLGISAPEVKKYSGNIIYVDNRPSITRSVNQREDIKIILQF